MMRRQEGYFLILAVIFILVIGVMGVIIAYNYSNRSKVSVSEQGGLQAFYVAESGLEIAARLLVGSNTLTCATLTGASSVTNASVLNGTFTATAVGGAVYSASTTLSSAITASANSMTVASASGMATHGRVRVDSEAIDYASISGSTLTGLNRGAAGTTAASHSLGASVTESVCLVDVQAGVPSLASPTYKRELQMAVEILNPDVWAVGAKNATKLTIIRWGRPTANVWNNYSLTDNTNVQDLKAVSVSSSTYGWAVGLQKTSKYTLVNWNGTSWTAAPMTVACTGVNTQNLNGVSVISATEGWAVGGRYPTPPTCSTGGTPTYRYDILKWDGTSWTILSPSSSPSLPADNNANQNLTAISMLDTNGDGAADYGFAVGDSGTILRYTGASWVASTSGVSNNLTGVSVVSGSEAWAVGASGRILKWNGSTWSTFTSPTSTALNAIDMVDTNGDGLADAGWAVGNSGVVIFYNGSTWATQTSGTSNVLNGVAAPSSSSAFAVGNTNTLLQYASGWSTVSAPANVSYNGICSVPGSATATGTQVGSWQQVFH